jgi:hypothetical protein
MYGLTINDSLLNVHATLIPKIMLMDYQFKRKIKDDSIVIDILYEPLNYKNAISLKNKIDVKYKNGIKSYKIETRLVAYSDENKPQANIYYIFPTTSENIEKVIEKSKINHALTFSYLEKDLQYGVMLSLDISKKIKPIVNLNAIRKSHITFHPVLLNISKIYVDSNVNVPSSFLEKLYMQCKVV